MKSLEGVVRVDPDLALETAINFECDHTGFSGLHECEVVLGPDDVLQLSPDEDAAQEPVQG